MLINEPACKNLKKIGLRLIRRVSGADGSMPRGLVACDAAYGCDHAFLDSLGFLNAVRYSIAVNSKEKVFLEYSEMKK